MGDQGARVEGLNLSNSGIHKQPLSLVNITIPLLRNQSSTIPACLRSHPCRECMAKICNPLHPDQRVLIYIQVYARLV